MSLTSALNIASSGMRAAQAGMRTVSDNITNVNTPGYARKIVHQSPAVISGGGAGVKIDGVRRAVDVYLQKATLDAGSEIGRSGVVAEFLNRAQSLFGDPTEASSFFNRLDPVFSSFARATGNPTSNLLRSEISTHVKGFFDASARIGGELRDLQRQTEVRIESLVSRVNGLLDDINALNVEISRGAVSGRDVSGSENVQSPMLDELSKLLDLRISRPAKGGVTLAASDGTLLTGENRARLEVAKEGGATVVRLKFEFGEPSVPTNGFVGGELKGLIELRDKVLPEIGEQLGEFTTRAADALNRAHNASSAVPAPVRLTGRPINATLTDAVEGFTGRSVVAITDPSGALQRRVDIDFTNTRLTVNGATTTWAPGGFQAALNAALSPSATVSFDAAAGGVLEIAATGANGVTVADDPDAPSNRAGRGFSHYFGLNDLVDSPETAFYDNGLTALDSHGFTPGGKISLRFNDGTGARFSDAVLEIPSGGTLGDLQDTLNASPAVNRLGAFSLINGSLRFTSKVQPSVVMTVLQDDTVAPNGGKSLSEIHGFGAQRAGRAETFVMRPAIAGDVNRIALAQLNFGATNGTAALARGDDRGAFALSQAGEARQSFERAGDVNALTTSLSRYGEQLGGAIGSRSKLAQEREIGAEIVMREASARRSSVEGVNLDEELIQLTVYQQAYNASARLITAAKEMYDVLLSIA